MDRKTIFICHTPEQKKAVCEVLMQRGEPVSSNAFAGDARFPVMMWDNEHLNHWVGYHVGARKIKSRIEEGYKVINLNESSTRGGY